VTRFAVQLWAQKEKDLIVDGAKVLESEVRVNLPDNPSRFLEIPKGNTAPIESRNEAHGIAQCPKLAVNGVGVDAIGKFTRGGRDVEDQQTRAHAPHTCPFASPCSHVLRVHVPQGMDNLDGRLQGDVHTLLSRSPFREEERGNVKTEERVTIVQLPLDDKVITNEAGDEKITVWDRLFQVKGEALGFATSMVARADDDLSMRKYT
jgi:hypothetical protein